MTSENFLITIKTLLFDMVAENTEKIQTRHNECVVEKRKIIKLAFNNSLLGFLISSQQFYIYGYGEILYIKIYALFPLQCVGETK